MIQELVVKGCIEFGACSTELERACLPVLHRVRAVLAQRPGLCVRVEGHTDNSPMWGEGGNMTLSEGRAEEVVRYLLGHANASNDESEGDAAVVAIDRVRPHQLIPVGFGDSLPVASNSSRDGKRRNRRVEFHVLTIESARSLRTIVADEHKCSAVAADAALVAQLHALCRGEAGVSAAAIRFAAADLLLACGVYWHVERLLWLAVCKGHSEHSRARPRTPGGRPLPRCWLAMLPSELVRHIMRFYVMLC